MTSPGDSGHEVALDDERVSDLLGRGFVARAWSAPLSTRPCTARTVERGASLRLSSKTPNSSSARNVAATTAATTVMAAMVIGRLRGLTTVAFMLPPCPAGPLRERLGPFPPGPWTVLDRALRRIHHFNPLTAAGAAPLPSFLSTRSDGAIAIAIVMTLPQSHVAV